jgi:hypothetical protein
MQPADRPSSARMRRASALVAGLLLAAGAYAAGDTSVVSSQLPDMGSPENAVLSKTDEYQIGLMAMRELRGQDLILEDPELTDYIQHPARAQAQARDDDQNFQYSSARPRSPPSRPTAYLRRSASSCSPSPNRTWPPCSVTRPRTCASATSHGPFWRRAACR